MAVFSRVIEVAEGDARIDNFCVLLSSEILQQLLGRGALVQQHRMRYASQPHAASPFGQHHKRLHPARLFQNRAHIQIILILLKQQFALGRGMAAGAIGGGVKQRQQQQSDGVLVNLPPAEEALRADVLGREPSLQTIKPRRGGPEHLLTLRQSVKHHKDEQYRKARNGQRFQPELVGRRACVRQAHAEIPACNSGRISSTWD